jgi:hypothetical protein
MSTLSGGVAQGSVSGDLTTRSSAKWGDAGRLGLVAAARLHKPWGSNVPKAGIRSGSEITVLGTKQSSKHPAGYRFQRPGPGGAAVIRPRGAACTRSWRDVGGRKRTPNYRACVGNSNAVSPGGKEARATDVNRCAMAKRSVGVFGSDQASLAGIAAGVSRTKYRRSPRLPARSGRRWPGGSGL